LTLFVSNKGNKKEGDLLDCCFGDDVAFCVQMTCGVYFMTREREERRNKKTSKGEGMQNEKHRREERGVRIEAHKSHIGLRFGLGTSTTASGTTHSRKRPFLFLGLPVLLFVH
jgi:hypothetical protein